MRKRGSLRWTKKDKQRKTEIEKEKERDIL